MLFIILAANCGSPNPLFGTWDLEATVAETDSIFCERIVFADGLQVCDGNRLEVIYSKRGETWNVLAVDVIDGGMNFIPLGANKIGLVLPNGNRIEYGRVGN